jgi:hypothetical protein
MISLNNVSSNNVQEDMQQYQTLYLDKKYLELHKSMKEYLITHSRRIQAKCKRLPRLSIGIHSDKKVAIVMSRHIVA